MDALSSREARKLEQVQARRLEEEARERARQLKAALREPSPERSAEARALLERHPEETARLRASMAKTVAAKEAKETNATEVEEDAETLQQKIAQLGQMLKNAKHAVVYTGAGLSTAANIPDYRGPQGLWTMHNKRGGGSSDGGGGGGGGLNAPCAARAAMGQSFAETRPTAGHMALAALQAKGLVKHIISQNVDGLHLRSGVPPSKLCELHGNVRRQHNRSTARRAHGMTRHDTARHEHEHEHEHEHDMAQRVPRQRAPLAPTLARSSPG